MPVLAENLPSRGNGSFYTGGAYAYDGAGNIASLAASATQTDSFKYDALSRLAKASVHRAGYTHAYSYTYDAFGNLTQRTEALAGSSLTLLASLTDVNNYGFGANVPSGPEATGYIQALAFGATVSAPGGVPNNRVASVQRGGTIGGVDTGLAQSNASFSYDPNGNLVNDGKFLYAYDPLNRQVSVSDAASGGLLAEYAALPSGERASSMQYDGVPQTPSVTDYARYLRDGAAVVWEKRDSTGRQKSYLYAGGRMAFTKESYLVCGFGGLALQGSTPTATAAALPTLGAPQVSADASGLTATASFAVSTVPESVCALEIRLVKGNSLVSSQRIEKPAGGWCGGSFATFGGLPEGADYQLGLTALSRAGMAKVMPPKAYLVERLRLGLVKGRLAAWTARRIKDDAGITKEELAAGFALLAPPGAENFTATAHAATGTSALTTATAAGDLLMPSNAASATVQGTAGTSLTLAAPSAISGGGIQPAGGIGGGCTRHAEYTYYAVDHLGTVRYTRTFDDTFTLLSASVHDYEPFGVEIPAQDACANTHRYTGQERDVETGNDNYHFRYFASSLGRFQKPDSIFGGAPNPQGWNLYSYVKGNPVNFNDPTGHVIGLAWVGKGNIYVKGQGGIQFRHDDLGGGLGLGGHPWDANPSGGRFDKYVKLKESDFIPVSSSSPMFASKDMSFQVNPAYLSAPAPQAKRGPALYGDLRVTDWYDEMFAGYLQKNTGELRLSGGGHPASAGLSTLAPNVLGASDCSGLIRRAINATRASYGADEIGNIFTSGNTVAGPGAGVFVVKANQSQAAFSTGDVVVTGGHMVAYVGPGLVVEASLRAGFVIELNMSRGGDSSYVFQRQVMDLNESFAKGYTV